MNVDISDKELLLPYTIVASMWKARKHITNLNDNTLVKTGVTNSDDCIKYSKLKDMVNRSKKWKKDNPNKSLQNVWINHPKIIATVTATTDWKNNTHIKNIIKVIGDFNNFTQFIEKLRAYAKSKKGLYKYYLNSRFIGTANEIKALTNGTMGNCVDWSQLARAVGIIMGYKVDYVQIQCTNVTHLIIRVSGKEFTKQTYIDLAAIVDWNSAYCSIGNACWCSKNGVPNKIVSINPAWINE
jgi:hypothetical protein